MGEENGLTVCADILTYADRRTEIRLVFSRTATLFEIAAATGLHPDLCRSLKLALKKEEQGLLDQCYILTITRFHVDKDTIS